MVGVILIVAGIVAIGASGAMTRRRVGLTFGRVDEVSMRFSEGTGVVPTWVSLINLGGWVLIIVGVIVVAIGVLNR